MNSRLWLPLFRFLTGMLLVFPGNLQAQEESPEPPMPVWSRPNVELPEYVRAEPGKLTLFADFEHPDPPGIPLYVVNRTQEKVMLDNQDGNYYMKLERQLPDGGWERVQSHIYSWCGNSYSGNALAPGMHCRLAGRRVLKEENATVRYSCYGRLAMSSNTASGLIDPADFQAARLDSMSMQGLPQEIRTLVDFPPQALENQLSRTVAALELMEAMGDLPAVRAAAAKWVDALAALPAPTAEQKLATDKAREILARPWAGRPSLERLMNRCLAALKNANPGTAAFGSPEKETGLNWEILAACGNPAGGSVAAATSPKPDASETPVWRTVLSLAATRAVNAFEHEAYGIYKVLSLAPLADEILPSKVFEDLLASPRESLVLVAAVTLTRREQWDRMVDLAHHLPPSNQLVVFRELTQALPSDDNDPYSKKPARYRPSGEKEQAFWDLVLRTQPLKASWLLSFRIGDSTPYDQAAFGELLAYWEREVARSQKETVDFALEDPYRGARGSVRLIAGWHYQNDLPLLRAMLNYRGYRVEKFSQSSGPGSRVAIVKHVFDVRAEAAAALRKLGEPVPKDLVFEVEVSRTPEKE